MGETKKLAMNLAEAEASEKTGKEPERNPNHEEMELVAMPTKLPVMFSLPVVERMIRYALLIQEMGYDYPHLHRKMTKNEIFREVLQTSIGVESAD